MPISSSNSSGSELPLYAEVFEFYDEETYSRYTSFQEPILYDGNWYKPGHIRRGKINRNIGFDAVTTNITAPLEEKLTRYLSNFPVVPTTVKVVRGLVDDFDAENVVVFIGVIKKVQIEDIYASAECVALSSILDATYPKDIHSAFCQNSLFDAVCGLDSNSYSRTVQIASLTGVGGLVIPELQNTGELYTGGNVQFYRDFRWITLGSGNTLSLHVPFPANVGPGTIVTVYQGCSKSVAVCRDKFNNVSRFFGCPYIPSDNPVLWGF